MREAKNKTIARNSLLLRALPEDQIEEVLTRSQWRSYARGETLFLQGERATAIHIVLDGWVKLFRVTPSGNEAVVSLFTRGESFAEAVALRGMPYPVSAEAVSACHVMHVPASLLAELNRRNPEVGMALLSAAFAHLHSLVEQLEQLKAHTGAQRVAVFLLALAECNGGSCEVTLPYDKILLAGRLGMKPESLSRSFSRLKRLGVTVDRSQAKILDVHALQKFADTEV